LEIYKILVVFYFLMLLMNRLFVLIIALFNLFVCFAFAENYTILNPSYVIDWDTVKIFWTDNSDWWYVDINLQDPETKSRFNFWSAEISDQVFTYTKQWDGDQNIWLVPSYWDEQHLCVSSSGMPCDVSYDDNHGTATERSVTRTVIPVTPKTWPSVSIIGIVLATLLVFGWYIYIKKKADI